MKAIASHTIGNNMNIINTQVFGFEPALRGMRKL